MAWRLLLREGEATRTMEHATRKIGLVWILLRAALLLGLMELAGACAPAVRSVQRPREATGTPAAPPAPGSFARVLTATWSQEGQGAMERAAKSGLVVFSSANGRLALLPNCRMNGQYRYFAIKPRRQHVALNDHRLVEVNVAPEAGASVPPSPVVLEMIRVGRLTTTRRAGEGTGLLGSCEGATHYARTLSIGEVLAGPPPPACSAATASDALPPPGCRRFLRAELVALSGARFDTGNGAIAFCPAEWALSDGVCVERVRAKGYECRDDPQECRIQCDLGDAASCTRLGYLLAHGEQGFVRDDKRALGFYERACGVGYAPACFNIGVLHAQAGDAPKEQQIAATYWDRACSDGYPPACSNLGALYARDASSTKARAQAVELFARACSGGDPVGCMNAVVVMRRMDQAEVDHDVGALLDLACDGDVAAGCFELAGWLTQHGAAQGSANAALEKACRLGSQDACRQHPAIREM
jgi:hypothetical protein